MNKKSGWKAPVRLKAFLVHLAASATLALISVGVVFGLWYPAPLHKALAVGDVFLLLLAVDVTIGPLLTLLVFKEGKKSLKFDLACIVLMQLSAFLYGMWTVAEGRPAWLVFNVDRFDLVQVYEIDSRRLNQAKADYRSPGWLGPRWVAAQLPAQGKQRNSITFEAVFSGLDIPQRPELYVPISYEAEAIRVHARSLDELRQFNSAQAVGELQKNWPLADAFLPLMAKADAMVVLVNKASAQVVAIVDLRPWE